MSRVFAQISRVVVALCAAWLLAFGGLATAQTGAGTPAWPTRPLRFVTGFPAGSATDSVARAMAEHVRQRLGQPVVVENRPGANGALGASEVARAAPDGHTVLFTNSSSITVNPQILRKPPYLPERDFTPVTMVVSAPFIVVVNTAGERTAGIQTLAELVNLARSRPGQLTFGSGGPGNLAHLGFEMLNGRAGLKTAHVPYKSGVNAELGLLGKEIDTLFDTPVAMPHIRAGRLRPLAVTTARRWPDLPDVPTVAESGYPGFDVPFWLGVLVPAATPPAIVQALYNALRTVREDPKAVAQLNQQGTIELPDPAEFAARVRAETAAWGEIIRRENIVLD